MTRAMFIKNFVEFSGREIKKLKGTNGDDSIALVCEEAGSDCTYTVNEQSETFAKDALKAFQLAIDPLAGKDNITVDIPAGMLLQRVQINLDNGDKTLFSKFLAPYASATINLGKGFNNTLKMNEDGSNIFIKGFNNAPNNKIQIKSTEHSIGDLEFQRENPTSETYDLYLKDADSQHMICSFFNQLSPQEYDLYAKLKVMVDSEEAIPPVYQSSMYVLHGPKVMDELLNAEHFVFSDN
jgi:hypothetical protein